MIAQKNRIGLLAAILLLCLYAATLGPAGCTPQPRPTQKITIGINLIGMDALWYLVKDKGFDREQGLEITLKPFDTGRDAIREVKARRLDLACCTEFALVSEIFSGGDQLRCLAALSSGDIHALIAPRDKGINRPEDLRGKAIGVSRGTSGEFFLGRFLTFNHISLHEVIITDLNPSELAGALAAARVDAVLTWEPVTHDILNQLSHNAVEWPAQEGQDVYWLLVSRVDALQDQSANLENLFWALSRAAKFAQDQPEATRAIIARWTRVPLVELQADKYPKRFRLLLDQGLLLAMEDQARWMIKHNLTGHTKVPNYLGYIKAEPLSRVNPQSVRLVVPGGQK